MPAAESQPRWTRRSHAQKWHGPARCSDAAARRHRRRWGDGAEVDACRHGSVERNGFQLLVQGATRSQARNLLQAPAPGGRSRARRERKAGIGGPVSNVSQPSGQVKSEISTTSSRKYKFPTSAPPGNLTGTNDGPEFGISVGEFPRHVPDTTITPGVEPRVHSTRLARSVLTRITQKRFV